MVFGEILDQISGTLDSYFCQSCCLLIVSTQQRMKVAELQKTNSQPKYVSKTIPLLFPIQGNIKE